MKNLKAITLLFLGLVLVACSSDDNGDSTPEPLTGDYFPSTMADLWIYNVENRNPDDTMFDFDATDLLTVNSETASSYTVEANSGLAAAAGSMNSFLTNGTLSKTDDMLSFTGDLELPEAFGGFSDAVISLDNVALYSLNADNGELSNTPGTITQDLDLDGTIFPLTIDYAFITTKMSSGNTLTVDGTSYDNVIKGNLRLEVSVTATVEILGAVSILSTQDVLSIDYYFAQDVGLIKADAVQGYAVDSTFIDLLEFSGIDLDIPTTVSVTNKQDLDSYVITE